jgi:hypothetical protein
MGQFRCHQPRVLKRQSVHRSVVGCSKSVSANPSIEWGYGCKTSVAFGAVAQMVQTSTIEAFLYRDATPRSPSRRTKNRSCHLGQSRQGRKNVVHCASGGFECGSGPSPEGPAPGGPHVPPLRGCQQSHRVPHGFHIHFVQGKYGGLHWGVPSGLRARQKQEAGH